MANREKIRHEGTHAGYAIPLGDGRQSPPKTIKRLYSIMEAATYLALSTWTIRELIWKGALPHVRLGRRILLDVQDLDALILHNKIRER